MKIFISLSTVLTAFASIAAAGSPMKGNSENLDRSEKTSVSHCSATTRKLKMGPTTKQEAEFETVAVPCHNHTTDFGSESAPGRTHTQNLSERKSTL
jgi:hypothetical protein